MGNKWLNILPRFLQAWKKLSPCPLKCTEPWHYLPNVHALKCTEPWHYLPNGHPLKGIELWCYLTNVHPLKCTELWYYLYYIYQRKLTEVLPGQHKCKETNWGIIPTQHIHKKKKSLWYHLHNVHPMKPWVLPAQCKPTGTHNSITFTTHISIPIQHDFTCTMQTQRNSMTRRKLWLYSHDDMILPV